MRLKGGFTIAPSAGREFKDTFVVIFSSSQWSKWKVISHFVYFLVDSGCEIVRIWQENDQIILICIKKSNEKLY